MHPHDATSFDPPAPFAHVIVISDALGTRVDDVPILLDSVRASPTARPLQSSVELWIVRKRIK